jgi:hypothetical protein
MKKTLLILLASFALLGCSDDGPNINKNNCNCGYILDDRASDYSILVENDCSGNIEWIQLYPAHWYNAHPGDRICFSDIQSW